MQLKKGMCFLCPNNKVVRQSENQEICNIITLLLPKDVLNSTEFDRIQASLRFCPICYHKLIIANRTRNNINSKNSNEVSPSGCRLCKNEENLFEINEWISFKKITEDLTLPMDSSFVTCSDCLYYLEIKNEMKMKLFSKYPKLRVKNLSTGGDNGRKLKPKFTPKIKLKSVPLLGKNKRKASRKRKFAEIAINSGDSIKDVNINFDTIKKLKPLKDHKLFSNHRLVKTDSKFLNQVPYVLVSIWNASDSLNNTHVKEPIMECNDKTFIDLTLDEDIDSSGTGSNNFKDNTENSETTAEKLNNSVCNNVIKKCLVVNVSRTNIEEYIQKPVSESTIQNLIEENDSNESCITPEENFLEEVENKNKRKSVSFAEEKNVEIEYFENESNIKFGDHSNSVTDPSQAVGKKYSKGILKRDDNMNGIKNNSESKNDDLLQILEGTEEVSDGKENNEQIQSVDSSSDNENMFDLYKSKTLLDERETAVAEESNENVEKINNKRKKIPQRSRPKPLSKKKRRDTIAEDYQDSSTNNLMTDDHNVVTNDEQKTNMCEVTVEDKSEKNNVCTSDAPVLDEEKTEEEECERRLSNTQDEQEGILDNDKNNKNISESSSEDKGSFEDILEPASKDEQTNTTNSDEEVDNEDEENKSEETEQDQASRTRRSSTSSPNVELEMDTPIDSSCNKDEEAVQSKDDVGRILEQNESIPGVEDDTYKIKSTNSTLEDEDFIDTDNVTNVIQFPNTLEVNDVEENSKNSGNPTLANLSHDSMPDCDDSQLVDNYVNSDDDGDHFINSQSKEKTVLAIEKDEEHSKGHDISSDNSKIDLSMDRFEDFEKNEDLGITDVDSDNINSILSHIFPSELPDDRLLFDTSKNENDLGNSTGGVNNKLHEDETLNINKEKKKKKVTFCDVT